MAENDPRVWTVMKMGLMRHKSHNEFTATWPHGAGRPDWMGHERHAHLYAGDVELHVVGESNFQENLWALVGRTSERVHLQTMALLLPETDNPHDPDAIAVWISGLQVGYLSDHAAHVLRHDVVGCAELTGQAVAVAATIAGGGVRRDDLIGDLEVLLHIDPVSLEVVGTWGPAPAL